MSGAADFAEGVASTRIGLWRLDRLAWLPSGQAVFPHAFR